MARILGIDPGSLLTGWGIVDTEGATVRLVASGTIRTNGVEFVERLRIIAAEVAEVVAMHAPDEVAVESAFVQKNASSALKLGHARAAAICGTFGRQLPISEYAPRAVKQAVVGKGAADKQQVQHMVSVLLGIKTPLQADESDALGVALCHAFQRNMRGKVGELGNLASRTRRGGRRR
ncbi:MAG: crossover junction endodeoxyribonuclease RuvC [Gammaproteobacteria bacterium]|nr:crossover junction endodeoxyribonuclease RuvC [Gammaproteobacteria bacterium]